MCFKLLSVWFTSSHTHIYSLCESVWECMCVCVFMSEWSYLCVCVGECEVVCQVPYQISNQSPCLPIVASTDNVRSGQDWQLTWSHTVFLHLWAWTPCSAAWYADEVVREVFYKLKIFDKTFLIHTNNERYKSICPLPCHTSPTWLLAWSTYSTIPTTMHCRYNVLM
jgi:hypothetical protein